MGCASQEMVFHRGTEEWGEGGRGVLRAPSKKSYLAVRPMCAQGLVSLRCEGVMMTHAWRGQGVIRADTRKKKGFC